MASYIGLNVGGKVYKTSITTLTRDPNCFFALLLSGRIPSAKDDQDNYLIDRDGEVFRHVLNYLRCDKLVLPEGFNEFRLIECEADFFMLPSLKKAVRELLGECLASGNQNIGLNVGGKIYQTTRSTLTSEPGSFFCAMLSGETQTQRDEHGNYMIDRDGDIFRYVMDFLRSGNLVLPSRYWFQNGELSREARFFELPVLHDQSLLLFEMQNSKSNMWLYCSKNRFVCYVKQGYENRLIAFSFLPNHSKYIDVTQGQNKTIVFELDKSLAGKTMTHNDPGPPRPCRYRYEEHDYPANVEAMLKSMKHICGNFSNKVKVSDHCTRYEFHT